MAEDKTEKAIYKEALEKETGFIEIFNRLSVSPDFEVWKDEFIQKPLESLQNELSNLDFSKKMNDAMVVQAQIRVLKQQLDTFDRRKNRKEKVHSELNKL